MGTAVARAWNSSCGAETLSCRIISEYMWRTSSARSSATTTRSSEPTSNFITNVIRASPAAVSMSRSPAAPGGPWCAARRVRRTSTRRWISRANGWSAASGRLPTAAGCTTAGAPRRPSRRHRRRTARPTLVEPPKSTSRTTARTARAHRAGEGASGQADDRRPGAVRDGTRRATTSTCSATSKPAGRASSTVATPTTTASSAWPSSDRG